MPIRVQCKCGQVLNVADTMAGKAGKCPKCQNVLKIPSSGGQAGSSSPATAQKTPSPSNPSAVARKASAKTASPVPPVAASRMDAMFEEAGLTKKVGNFCPNCDTPFPNGAILCTKCGLNLQTGEKLASHQTDRERAEFKNAHLNEAAQMMAREDEMQSRTLNSGTPWWVMLCVLLSGITIAAAGVIVVDGRLTDPQPISSPIGKIQAMPIELTLLGVLAINCILITNFAHFAVVATAFREKSTYGWLALFIPFYSAYYAILHFKEIRGTVIAYLIAVIIGIPAIVFLAIRLPQVEFTEPLSVNFIGKVDANRTS